MKSEGQIAVELQEHMGNCRSVAESAWTSSYDYQKKNSRSIEDVERVVNLLADSKHSVPFESIVFRFWIKLPIQTDRQHMTHRLQSASGASGRYRTMPSEWLAVPDDIYDILDILQTDKSGDFIFTAAKYNQFCENSNKFYQEELVKLKAVEKAGKITNAQYKRLREFLRGVLPQNNMTERVTVINLRSFANYYKLRSKADAQPEIQTIARLMLEEIKEKNVCPIAISALERNYWII